MLEQMGESAAAAWLFSGSRPVIDSDPRERDARVWREHDPQAVGEGMEFYGD